jgi:2,4-dienoyl-CoA reductase-like NADH-dependent reductase (Old Yellow Enzyme family)
MSSPAAVLAQPLRLRSGATLPNRLAKGAMSERLGDPDTGAPTDALVRLYDRWARGGAGLLITGNVIIDKLGRGEPDNVLLQDDRHLPAFTRWATAAQAHGARLWMQLNHAGRQSPRRLTRHPVAPSAVAMRGFAGMFARPRALEDGEIRAIIARFATAAAVAKAAGFHGVQLHGAHGYLISQFLSPRTNLRDDDWGGDPARRARFLVEIVRAVRAATGPAFPLGVKLNSADFQRGGFTIEEAMDVARSLEAEGVDLLEVSGGNYESPAMTGARVSTREREAYFLDYAQRIRGVTAMPLMLTGGLRTAAAMSAAIESGAVDVVGMARPLAYQPSLAADLLAGTSAGATPVDLSTGVRKLDDMLQIFWFAAQLRRMAQGVEPDLSLGKWRALVDGVRTTFLPGGHRAPALAPATQA